jgi:CheY-like chemotaxis protein
MKKFLDVITGNNQPAKPESKQDCAVLILSDDFTAIVALTDILSENYKICAAMSAPEMVELIEKSIFPEAIICDFVHPEMAKEFLEVAKIRMGKSSLPPVLFLRDSSEDEILANRLHASDLLLKPVAQELLLTTITKLISERKTTMV